MKTVNVPTQNETGALTKVMHTQAARDQHCTTPQSKAARRNSDPNYFNERTRRTCGGQKKNSAQAIATHKKCLSKLALIKLKKRKCCVDKNQAFHKPHAANAGQHHEKKRRAAPRTHLFQRTHELHTRPQEKQQRPSNSKNNQKVLVEISADKMQKTKMRR